MKKLPAIFFKTENGKEPVRDCLQGFTRSDKQAIGEDIKRVEFGWPIGMPTCEAMGDGMFQTRTNLATNRIARVFFCVEEGHMYVLHVIVKKTPRTPPDDLELARKRRRIVLKRLSEQKRKD